jgi:hypothetical protein
MRGWCSMDTLSIIYLIIIVVWLGVGVYVLRLK